MAKMMKTTATGLAQTNKQDACQCYEALQEIYAAGGQGVKRT